MALSKLAPKCRACPKVLTCDHKEMEMYGFLPIPEGGFDNPDVDIVAGVDVANGPDLTSNIIVHLTEKSIELGRPYPIKRRMKMVYSDEQVARLESIVDALCGKGLFKFAEQISLIMEAVGEFMQSVKTVTDFIAEMTAQYIPPEPVDSLSLEEAFQKFEKEASTVLDRSLSPREYGERLSWGSRGHRYKSRNYPYIPLFKRNLPYQKRAG